MVDIPEEASTQSQACFTASPLLLSPALASPPFSRPSTTLALPAQSTIQATDSRLLLLQVHGCSSYPLSFPSQPPDIKNWFSSYEYESPEAPELVADPGDDNGSETQDPLEYRVSGHSLLKHAAPQDAGVAASRENCFGGQSDHDVSAVTDLVPIGRSTVEQGAKRKQSLRELFGAGFLDDRDEATETESRAVFAVQRNAVEPLANCDAIGLPDIKESQQCAVEHGKLPEDCDGISFADTQESSPGDQESKHTRLSGNCDGTSLAGTEKSFLEDGMGHNKLPVNCNSTNPADTDKSSKEDDKSILPDNCNDIGSADTEESSRDEIGRCKPTLEYKAPEETVATDGFVVIKRQEKPGEESRKNKIPKPSMGRDKAELRENHSILQPKASVQERTRSPLADRTNFSEVAEAPTPELSGKWKCPRKGKPYVGPPLKQLRLEQWVRRVN